MQEIHCEESKSCELDLALIANSVVGLFSFPIRLKDLPVRKLADCDIWPLK